MCILTDCDNKGLRDKQVNCMTLFLPYNYDNEVTAGFLAIFSFFSNLPTFRKTRAASTFYYITFKCHHIDDYTHASSISHNSMRSHRV